MSEIQGKGPLEQRDVGDVTVLRVTVPLLWSDQVTEDLFGRLYTFVENSGRHKLVLDVGAIESLASAALGKLVALFRKVRANESRLVLCNVTPSVDRILQVTRLADVMVAYNSEGEALRSFG